MKRLSVFQARQFPCDSSFRAPVLQPEQSVGGEIDETTANLLGHPSETDLVVHPGGHQWISDVAIRWFREKLPSKSGSSLIQ